MTDATDDDDLSVDDSFIEVLISMIDERDEVMAFMSDQVLALADPFIKGIQLYLDLPKGNVDIFDVQFDDGKLILIGTINTSIGDKVADAHFGFQLDQMNIDWDVPNISQLVETIHQLDNGRDVAQRDAIIEMIEHAELEMYHDEKPARLESVLEKHVKLSGESLTEYRHRQLNTHKRTVH